MGSARRLAMQSAWELRPDPSHSVIFTTDADAVPMSNWIENTLQAIEAGADLVGGQIFGDEIEESRLGPQFVRRARFQLRYTQLIDRLAAVIDPLPHEILGLGTQTTLEQALPCERTYLLLWAVCRRCRLVRISPLSVPCALRVIVCGIRQMCASASLQNSKAAPGTAWRIAYKAG